VKDPFDTQAVDLDPKPVLSDPPESEIQSQCVDWARKRGYWARKFSSPANRSVPDYLFARCEFRDKFAVEFKRRGKKSTDAQKEEQRKMHEAGWDVYVDVDSVSDFKALVIGREVNAGA
jgi:hypothetical protein